MSSSKGPDSAERTVVTMLKSDGHIRPLKDILNDVMVVALDMYAGPSEAARHLKIARSTLYRKMVDMGFYDEDTSASATCDVEIAERNAVAEIAERQDLIQYP